MDYLRFTGGASIFFGGPASLQPGNRRNWLLAAPNTEGRRKRQKAESREAARTGSPHLKGHLRGGGGGRTYLPTYLFLRFFEIFRPDFRKYFYGVFELLMQRNSQKRDKKIEGEGEKRRNFCSSQLQLFWQIVFDMDFPKEILCL
jgi:hypothetical protein